MRMMTIGVIPVLLVMVVLAPIVYVPAVQPIGCNYSCMSGGHGPMTVSLAKALFGFGACLNGLIFYFPC